MCAINDALAPLGVRATEVPASPKRLWKLLERAKSNPRRNTPMAKTDPFVALSECHFMNPQTLAEISYYPQHQRWWASVDGVMRAWAGRDLPAAATCRTRARTS